MAPQLIEYHDTWDKIDAMLVDILSKSYRRQTLDSFGNGWIFNWFCADHVGYHTNPRRRDIGYHKVFDHYRKILAQTDSARDAIYFHYHPMPLNRQAHCNATHYFAHGDTLFQILARRIIDRKWFPSAYRPGFHVIRPDSHWFLEQFIPFDFSNQAGDYPTGRDNSDLAGGRFGDWRRAPKSWQPYHPDHDDYQKSGNSRRLIFRCLNIGTRHSCITQDDVNQAFSEAADNKPIVLAFTNHDYRNMRTDVETIRGMLSIANQHYPNVKFRFCRARQAARLALRIEQKPPPRLQLEMNDNRLRIRSDTPIFGPQPFYAFKTRTGDYYHDNLDFQECFREWTYVFDQQTFPLSAIETIGLAACDNAGNVTVVHLDVKERQIREYFI